MPTVGRAIVHTQDHMVGSGWLPFDEATQCPTVTRSKGSVKSQIFWNPCNILSILLFFLFKVLNVVRITTKKEFYETLGELAMLPKLRGPEEFWRSPVGKVTVPGPQWGTISEPPRSPAVPGSFGEQGWPSYVTPWAHFLVPHSTKLRHRTSFMSCN